MSTEFPGGLYHITYRGDRREAIYLDDADRRLWLELFGQLCRRYNWACHAYCLMDNPYHIVGSLQDQLCLGDAAFAEALRQSAHRPTNPTEIPRIQRRANAQPLAYFVALPER